MSWQIKHQEYEDFENEETKTGYRFYDSVSGTFFGPAMKTRLELGAFLLYLLSHQNGEDAIPDPRSYSTPTMKDLLPGFRRFMAWCEAEL